LRFSHLSIDALYRRFTIYRMFASARAGSVVVPACAAAARAAVVVYLGSRRLRWKVLVTASCISCARARDNGSH